MEGLAKEHMCITHGRRHQCGDGLREGGSGTGWRWAAGGGGGDLGTSVIVPTVKIKLKNNL